VRPVAFVRASQRMARQAVSQRLHEVLDLERQNTIPDRKH
jgi:hypothetical protein